MANNSFDRTIINARERPLSSDINQAQAQLDRALRESLRRSLEGPVDPLITNLGDLGLFRSCFVGSAFKVRASSPAGMSVVLDPGLGLIDAAGDVPAAIDAIAGLSDLERAKPALLNAAQSILAVPASDPVNPRVDIVEVRYDRRTDNPLSRDVLDPGTGTFVPGLVDKSLAWALDGLTSVNGTSPINYKTGVAGPGALPPATSAGYVKVAEVIVPGGVAAIQTGNLTDLRRMALPGGIGHVGVSFRHPNAPGAPTLVQVIAPPGVTVCVRRVSASTGIVYVFAGDVGVTAAPGTLAHSAYSGVALPAAPGVRVHFEHGIPISQPITAAESGQLVAPTVTAPTRDATFNAQAGSGATGQPALQWSYSLFSMAAAPPVATAVDVDVTMVGQLRYR